MKLKVPAWLFMVLAFAFGIALYIFSMLYEIMLSGISLNEIIKDLSLVLVTTCILNFLFEVSSANQITRNAAIEFKKELLNDMSIFSSKAILDIIRNCMFYRSVPTTIDELVKRKLDEHEIDVTGDILKLIDNEINSFKLLDGLLVYYKTLSREVTMTLYDDRLKVDTTLNAVYINPYLSKLTFRLQPIFSLISEAASFEVNQASLNGVDIPIKPLGRAHQATMDQTYFCKNPMVIDLSKYVYSRVSVMYEFITTADGYYHSSYLKYHARILNFQLGRYRTERDSLSGAKMV